MQIRYIIALALIALFVVPGTASQLAMRTIGKAPLLPVPLGASTGGLFNDPGTAQLSIQWPTRFRAIDIDTRTVGGFTR